MDEPVYRGVALVGPPASGAQLAVYSAAAECLGAEGLPGVLAAARPMKVFPRPAAARWGHLASNPDLPVLAERDAVESARREPTKPQAH